MTTALISTELHLPGELSPARDSCAEGRRFPNLRGVRWRIDLGILPASPPASIDDLRRVAADSRRRYASMRRRLLIDPHLSKDGNRSPDPGKDNPLSENPDSVWSQFFRNAELEKMVDRDLSRLYPEHGSYFQTPLCQAMLRRILLLWCLRHTEYGYRQGMHELLAPLLYVLHVDLQHLCQVQGQYGDLFNDGFDDIYFLKVEDNDVDDDNDLQKRTAKISSLDDLDPDTRDIFWLSDAYGAEGELGVILSEKFMEHDAYCMFDNLMNGSGGVVAIADFFSPSPAVDSNTGISPVIEASSALYHLLSFVDPSLHSHLVELGAEPQYFALRWLRVLFGREFSLDDLLVIWDELFSSSNTKCIEDDAEYSFRILCSSRGAFISAMAVSMLLHVRSSLFATEIATSCLQRLLNFPKNIKVKKLIEKANSLRTLALATNSSSSSSQLSSNKNRPTHSRVYSLSCSSTSPETPVTPVLDSYWEEKWRILHTENVLKKGSQNEKFSGRTIRGSLVERFGLSRTESDPSPTTILGGKKDTSFLVRRKLLNDLSQEVDSGEGLGKIKHNGLPNLSHSEGTPVEIDVEKTFHEEPTDQNITERTFDCTAEEIYLSGDNSSVFSAISATNPHSMGNDEGNNSDKSSITSNSSVTDNDEEINQVEELCNNDSENPPPQGSETANTNKVESSVEDAVKHDMALKDQKPFSGKFHWFLRFGRGSSEGSMEKGGNTDLQRSSNVGNVCSHVGDSATICNSFGNVGRSEGGDTKGIGSLKNLGHSMLENVQVIESAFQQERRQVGNILGGKGQVAAIAALKELRKISNILSEI